MRLIGEDAYLRKRSIIDEGIYDKHKWLFDQIYIYINPISLLDGSETIDTQDKVICNENRNYAMIQNKEKG